MSNEGTIQEYHESRFGVKPQPLQPVMDPQNTPCPDCHKPLAENVGDGSDYLFFQGDGQYWHRKCLTARLKNVYVEGGD